MKPLSILPFARDLDADLRRTFQRRPADPYLRWEGGSFWAPTWVAPEQGSTKPFRPALGIWFDAREDQALGGAPTMEDFPLLEAAIRALQRALTQPRHGPRPGILAVRDADLAESLGRILGGTDVRIILEEEVEALDVFYSGMLEFVGDSTNRPSIRQKPRIGDSLLDRFARAAVDFYDAAIWNLLTPEDAIHVVRQRASAVGRGARKLVSPQQGALFDSRSQATAPDLEPSDARDFPWEVAMLVGRGAGNPTLILFESAAQLEEFEDEPGESVTPSFVDWVEPWDLRIEDHDYWQARGLPTTTDGRYPSMAIFAGSRVDGPLARELEMATDLLDALLPTTEQNVEKGQWQAPSGKDSFHFSLPHLLEPEVTAYGSSDLLGLVSPFNHLGGDCAMRRFRATTEARGDLEAIDLDLDLDLETFDWRSFAPDDGKKLSFVDIEYEHALELAALSIDALGRRSQQLARQAVETHADCADAHRLLAELATDPEVRRSLYEEAINAGRRWIERVEGETDGTTILDGSDCWVHLDARPYIRALAGYGHSLLKDFRFAEGALLYLGEAFRLDYGDHCGIAFAYAAALAMEERWAQLWKIRDERPHLVDDEAPIALLVALGGKMIGEQAAATSILSEVVRDDRKFAKWLAAAADDPDSNDAQRPRSRLGESLGYDLEVIAYLCETYSTVSGAVGWLRSEIDRTGRNRSKRARRESKKGSKTKR